MATVLIQQHISWYGAYAGDPLCGVWWGFASRTGAFPWLGRDRVPEMPAWIAAGACLEEF